MKDEKTSHQSLSAEIRQCPQCGKAFIPKRKDQKYCSPACRKKASRQRLNATDCSGRPPVRHRHTPHRHKQPSALTQEDFEEMVDPLPSYEDMLRLTVRRLKKAIESEGTSSRDLPALSRQLLAASKELEDYQGDRALTGPDSSETEVLEDVEFSTEAI